MRRLLIVPLIAIFNLPILLLTPSFAADLPQIETSIPGLAVNTLSHDMGDIFWGEIASFTFTVHNSSDRPIELQRIRSDCGCRTLIDDQAPMNPGDTRHLTVMYEPEYNEGAFTKKVTVYTDFPIEQEKPNWIEFTLSGRIVSILSLDPWHIFFKKVTEGQESVETIQVRADKDVAVTIQEVSTGSEHLQAVLETVSPTKDVSGSDWQITVTLLDTAPAGTFSGYVQITTDHTVQKTIRLRALAYIRSAVSIYPTQCYLGTVDPGQVITKTFTVEKAGEEPGLKPPVVQSSFDWAQSSVETVEENRKYNVVLTITIPEDGLGRFSGEVVIETHDASTPTFNVPIFGFIFAPPTDAASQEPLADTEQLQPPDDGEQDKPQIE